jgi:hypothetical protein
MAICNTNPKILAAYQPIYPIMWRCNVLFDPKFLALFNIVMNMPETAVMGKLAIRVVSKTMLLAFTVFSRSIMMAIAHTEVGIMIKTMMFLRSLKIMIVQMLRHRRCGVFHFEMRYINIVAGMSTMLSI